MEKPYLKIVLLAFIGLMLGLIVFVNQSDAGIGMNPFGLVAFSSLGASIGCLMVDQDSLFGN